MNMNRPLIFSAAALLLVLADAATASAGTVLPSGTVLTGSASQQYSYTTSHPYWSVTAVQPTTSSEYFLSLDDKNGNQLQASDYGTGLTNFIAVDSNSGTQPYQTYVPNVNRISASGSYWVQALYGSTEVSIPTPTHQGTTGFADSDISYMNLNSNNVVSIADIYLTAGESFWASTPVAANELFLLEADSSSYSWIQNRVDATIKQKTKVIDNCTLYTASVSGWHALVMIGDTPPVTTNPQQGIAFGLHQYDATYPNYCPMADFPGPTPAP